MPRRFDRSLTATALVTAIFAALAGTSSQTALAESGSDQNVRGFSGTNLSGFSGTNLSGFSGTNLSGFSGTNLSGFSGTNLSGFSGTNLSGFSGTNLSGFSGTNVDLAGCQRNTADGFGDGFVAAAMGAVDKIVSDQKGASIVVAGQAFAVSAADVDLFQVGDYVVAGSVASGTSTVAYHVGVPYVPGVSPVRVKGAVTAIDLTKGTLSIGTLSLDYTPQLATAPMLEPQVGDAARAVGVQPAQQGPMLLSTCASGLLLDRA